MILFGHPTGSPFSHHAALAHQEAGRLEAFCVPWMPTARQSALLSRMPGRLRRLQRRGFAPLESAPKVQGQWAEGWRLMRRMADGEASERLAYSANDWLMKIMRQECHRTSVTAVHAYEDCSLWQFEEARKLGKVCIYDMPIGYYPAWQIVESAVTRRYADWLPPAALSASRWVRPDQKRQELELADLVLAPSAFVRDTVAQFVDKTVHVAPYGVDAAVWSPADSPRTAGELRVLFVGQISVRKGVPLLLDAWRIAGLKDAKLDLVGPWKLADAKRWQLPAGVTWIPPQSQQALLERYREADLFVFPTFFEGRALVVGEAMACGLPVVTTHASGAGDLVDESCGRLIPTGDLDALVEVLRDLVARRASLLEMGRTARARASVATWQRYRSCVSLAVDAVA